MRRLCVAVIAVVTFSACSRDMSLPPPPAPPGAPEPGTVYGRIVYAQPGKTEKVPAAGATVQVLGTTLSATTTDAQGRFLISGITSSSGQLLVRFDASATGQATHQVLVDLGALGVGLGLQISVGDLVVSQNAQLHGKVLRGDVPGSGGHGGTVVYVPQGPYTTYTGDDGSFQLAQLPSGTLSVAFFRVGYKTITLDGIALRAGEEFALRDQLLSPDVGGSAVPGTISGHVDFSPATTALGASVVAVDGLGNAHVGTITAAGDFAIAAVPPGLYQVTISQTGYAAGRVSNLLVGAGQSVVLPGLVLEQVTPAGGGGGACVAGDACQPANLCRLGTVSCSAGGAATCVDGAVAIDGTACGSGQVCKAGACSPYCVGDGGACTPANVCHAGVTTCTAAGPICSEVLSGGTPVNLPDGTPCAPGNACRAGACLPPAPGTVSGRIVYAQPGQGDKVPAAGATVQVLGTTLSTTTTGADGRFVVEGFTESAGQLLVRFDATATGQPTHQVLVELGPLGVGLGKQVSLGDLVVSQNAQLHGRVLRGDVTGTSGHGGTVVYVPQVPYETSAADDGTFRLPQLPAGTFSVAFYRVGYQTLTVDGITFRAGEDFALRDQLLSPDVGGSAAPGAISGHVDLSPATSAAGASVVAVDGLGSAYAAVAGATGDFTIAGVPPGLYQVTVSQTGYAAGRVSNVLVDAGQSVVLPGLVLEQVTPAGGGGGACVAGDACQPANPCRLGTVSCSAGGAATCQEGANAIDGTACGSGQVCRAGACIPFCAADGSTCSPANACHVGVTTCSAAGAVCSDTGVNLPNGAPCAPGKVCSGGACVDCTGPTCGVCSTVCVPANPCHIGSQICGTGSAGCTDLGTPAADGTGCGTNQVCLAGTCVACAAGVVCQPDNPCKTGISSCAGGVRTCAETGDLADGIACGGANTCRAGACSPPLTTVGTLARNTPATSTTTVYAPTGVVVAANGDVYFSDSNHHQVKRIMAGSTTPVVVAGTGVAGFSGDGALATAAQLYAPKGLALDESGTGTLYVADSGNDRVREIQLGGSRFISTYAGGGASTAQPFGDEGPASAATLSNPTRLLLAWDQASPPVRWLYVADSGRSRIRRIHNATTAGPGTDVITTWLAGSVSCGGGVALYDCSGDPAGCSLVFDGQGNGFVSGRICGGVLGGNVAYGVLRVSPAGTLAPVAGQYLGNASEGINGRLAGFAAAPALAIDAAGNLYTADSQANRVRRIDGASGRIDTVVNLSGAATTTGDGGSGLAATIARPWAIAFDPVTRTDLVLTEGPGPTSGAGNAVRVVRGMGTTTPPQAALLAASGDGQTTAVDQLAPLPVSVRLVDGGGAPLAGYAVTFASLTPGGSVSAASVATDAGGFAAVTIRAGQAPGTYRFEASFTDVHGNAVAGSPRPLFTLQATPIPAGTIQAVVNAPRNAGNATSGPAVLAATNGPTGLAVASDGTIYFADYVNHRVKAVDPSGVLSVVAGTGACAATGDGGPATSAALCGPKALALDEREAGRRLYVADYGNDRVRVVDLALGTISLVAGGGTTTTAPAPGYGDGGTATAAVLANPTHLVLRDEAGARHLYVTDHGHGRIRRVRLSGPGAGIVEAAFAPTGVCGTTSATPTWYDCGSEPGCALAFDPQGNAFVSGRFCSADAGSYAAGVARISPGGTLTHVAGKLGGTAAEGVSARAAAFSYPPALALDAGGSLFTSDWGAHRVRRVDGTTGRIDTVAGTGIAASAGDGGPATSATLSNPWDLVFDAATRTTLYVSEYAGNAVRVVPGAGSAASTAAALAAAGPTSEAVPVSHEGTPLAVRLTGGGLPLVGYPIAFASLTTGGSLSASAVLTGADGVAAAAKPRAGLAAGVYRFEASFEDLHGRHVPGSPIPFTLSATAPATGSIAAIVDLARVVGNSGVGGPASVAQIRGPTGVAVASDGTVFFSDHGNHQVKAISPGGVLSLVAGTGTPSFTGDGGPAIAATLYSPRGLALDEESPATLYVADATNDRIRAVNLVTGQIDTVAGGGSAGAPGYGDGGAARSATLAGPTQVVVWRDPVSSTKALYVTDFDHGRIRRVDLDGLAAGTITAFLTPTLSCAGAVGWYDCNGPLGCSVVLDGPGTGFVSGRFCGSDFGGNYTYGVARFGPGGPIAQVAGLYLGSANDGISARAASFPGSPALALDAAGNLYTLDWTGNEIRRIDAATGRIESVVGTGTAGTTGDGGPAAAATLTNPYLMAFDPLTLATLYLSDYGGNTVRVVPGLGRTAPSTAHLALTRGLQDPVWVDSVAPVPLAVTLTDGAGAPLAGYRVDFRASTPGGAVGASRVLTDGAGGALASLRVGLLPQAYRFRASFEDIRGTPVPGSPATVDVVAVAPGPGTAFVAVNSTRTAGSAGVGGPGTLAQVNAPTGAAMAPDGTVYFSDYYNHQVKALAPNGVLTVVAGTRTCGFSGDGGQAAAATLCYPLGLALDPAPPGTLYVADSYHDRVRAVNLGSGVISLVAGSGTATAAPWGDGGPPTAATLSGPAHVRLHGGKLYVADTGHNLVRVVELSLATPTISTFVGQQTPFTCPSAGQASTDVVFYSCGGDVGCDVAWDAAGNAYVSGYFCGGTQMGRSYFHGIVRTNDGVALDHVAGFSGAQPAADGSVAAATPLAGPASIAVGVDGRLYYQVRSEHALRVIDLTLATPTVATVAGAVPAPVPIPGNGADYVPAGSLRLDTPWDFALQPGGGHAAICDTNNHAVRLVW